MGSGDRYLPPDVAANVFDRLSLEDLRSARYVSTSFREQSVTRVRESQERKDYDHDIDLILAFQWVMGRVGSISLLPPAVFRDVIADMGEEYPAYLVDRISRTLGTEPDAFRFRNQRMRYFSRVSVSFHRLGTQSRRRLPHTQISFDHPSIRDLEFMTSAISKIGVIVRFRRPIVEGRRIELNAIIS